MVWTYLANAINSKNHLVQTVYTSTAAKVTCATVLPYDDTIPQKTEGDEVLTLSITPKSATNILQIIFCGLQSFVTNNQYALQAALFQDDTDNALAAVGAETFNNAGYLNHLMLAGTTSATTFKIRCGGDPGDLQINATNAGALFFNGVASTVLIIREYISI